MDNTQNNSSEFAPNTAMSILKAFLNPTDWIAPENGIEVDYYMPGAIGDDQLGSAQEAVDYVLSLMHTNQLFQVCSSGNRMFITGNDCRLEFYYYQTERKTPFLILIKERVEPKEITDWKTKVLDKAIESGQTKFKVRVQSQEQKTELVEWYTPIYQQQEKKIFIIINVK